MAAPEVDDGASDAAFAAWLRGLLRHVPAHPELYRVALTHRSARHEHNERLEFLGDAVLGMVVAEELFRRFPAASEGTLSRLRARLVSTGPLAGIGAAIGIGPMLRLGSGELRSGGFRRESILADATEALFGAAYLDGGLEAARGLILGLYARQLDELRPEAELKDAKTRLQELLQGRAEALPMYMLEGATGEPHEQVFAVRCEVHLAAGGELRAEGTGSSRRRAEQQAAAAVLAQLQVRWRA
ncbi:MAG TPA: ribonuclease III [Steroidobacteraceae bacterium]|nr:ribonuclease III [Steroidobacteraceae bacterium]